MTTEYHWVDTAHELATVLRQLEAEAEAGHSPILHLECHGGKQGIELASGEKMGWHQVKAHITPINIKSKTNLIVTLAACWGAWLSSVAVPPGRAPFVVLVGPAESIGQGFIEISYTAFYEELLTSFNFGHALMRMEHENGGLPFNYGITTAREIFEKGYAEYRRTQMTPEALAEREDAFIKAVRKAPRHPHYFRLDFELRAIYRAEVDSPRATARFERFKERFFMADLYPENYIRFGLDLLRGEA